jgi:hypothetical protein
VSFLLQIGLGSPEVTSERDRKRERETERKRDDYPLDILNPKVAC